MISAVLLMLASGTVGLPDLGALLTTADYPDGAYARNESFAATVDLILDPSGSVASCKSTMLVGSEELARKICDIAIARKVEPASSRSGQPEYFHTRTIVRFVFPHAPGSHKVATLVLAPDATVTVSALPGRDPFVDVPVSVLVDEGGKVIECDPSPFVTRSTLNAAKLACANSDKLGLGSLVLPTKGPLSRVESLVVRLKREQSS
ncbi:MAG: hypothetical protein ACKOQM_07500 [Novosphingobium sp.]